MTSIFDLRLNNHVWHIEETRWLWSEPVYLVFHIPVDFFDRYSPAHDAVPRPDARLWREAGNLFYGYDLFGGRFNVIADYTDAVLAREMPIPKPRGRFVWHDGEWGKWRNGVFIPRRE